MVEDEAGDALDGRVAVEHVDRLAELPKRGDERIVVTEQHPVIELRVDPPLDDALDVAEVAHHVAGIQRVAPDFDLDHGIVPVRVPALAVVVQEPVPVAEIDPFRHRIHGVMSGMEYYSKRNGVAGESGNGVME